MFDLNLFLNIGHRNLEQNSVLQISHVDPVLIFGSNMHQKVKVGKVQDHLMDCDSLIAGTPCHMSASLDIKGVEILPAVNTQTLLFWLIHLDLVKFRDRLQSD